MYTTATTRLRVTLALLIGVPVTVVYLPLAAYVGCAGLDMIFRDGPWNNSPLPIGLLTVTWSAAGIAGLVGFWIWVWQPVWNRTTQGKLLIAMFVAAGMVVVAPLAKLPTAPLGASVLSLLSALSLVGGAVVLYTQLRHLRDAA